MKNLIKGRNDFLSDKRFFLHTDILLDESKGYIIEKDNHRTNRKLPGFTIMSFGYYYNKLLEFNGSKFITIKRTGHPDIYLKDSYIQHLIQYNLLEIYE